MSNVVPLPTPHEKLSGLSGFLRSRSTDRAGSIKNEYHLRCLVCAAPADLSPSCQCGVAYDYIAPGELAEWAVRTHPEQTDRAIAEILQIDHKTVGKARLTVGENSPTAKRVGKDGKSYPAKRAAKPKPKSKAQPKLTRTLQQQVNQIVADASDLASRVDAIATKYADQLDQEDNDKTVVMSAKTVLVQTLYQTADNIARAAQKLDGR